MTVRANPSPDAYERARKIVHEWLRTLHPDVVIPEDDGGQLIDSLAWAFDAARIARQADAVWYRSRGGIDVMKSDERHALALLKSQGFQSFMRNYVAGFASQDGGVIELAHALAAARGA